MPRPEDITRLLSRHRQGDSEALDRVVELLYVELRDVARRLRPRAGGSLDTGALLHEGYLKLARAGVDVRDREHFKAVAARAMRQIAVDHARSRRRQRRGAGADHTDLGGEIPAPQEDGPSPEDVLTLHTLLEELSDDDSRLVRVVECRFFAGMSETETARCLDLSVATVQRDWQKARHELHRRLRAHRSPDAATGETAGGADP